jgi:TPR repeat protein
LKIITIIFILLTSSSSFAWFFSSPAEDFMDECRKGTNRGYSCIAAGEWYSGLGSDLNYHMALNAYRIGCRHNLAEACDLAGIIVKEGKGKVDVDNFSAVRFFTKSCDLDFDKGCANLAIMYHRGKGIIQSNIESAKYDQKACDLGSETGCYNLGVSYQNGYGVQKNNVKALRYYRKACDLELQDGCDNYSKLKR